MKLRLKHIDPIKISGIAAIIMFVISFIIIIPFGLIINNLPMPEDKSIGMMGSVIYILPFIYSAFGFLANLIIISFFNFLAKKMGGIEIEFDEEHIEKI
jgi:hypothetical protein